MTRTLISCALIAMFLVSVCTAVEPFFEQSMVFQRTNDEDHYRGPHIVQMPNGVIVVNGGLKLGHMRDAGGKEVSHYKYSTDDGKTWQDSSEYKMADLVDGMTGKVFQFRHHWPMNDANGKAMTEAWIINNPQKGIEIGSWAQIGTSCDNGKTWNKRDFTKELFTYKNGGLAWFIGRGIQLQKGPHKGRLIVPGRFFGKKWERVGPEACNTLAYSDDHGESWHWGGAAQGYTGEACVVELADGSVYINNRNHDPKTWGFRSWAVSHDGGETFTEFGVAEDLPEPKCHAAMVRHSFPDARSNTPGRVLFFNPAVSIPGKEIAPSEGRKNLTVRVSYDDCKTWPISKTIFPGKGGYSDMIVTKEGTIMCAFECGEEMYAENICLIRFNIEWLESGFVPKIK